MADSISDTPVITREPRPLNDDDYDDGDWNGNDGDDDG